MEGCGVTPILKFDSKLPPFVGIGVVSQGFLPFHDKDKNHDSDKVVRVVQGKRDRMYFDVKKILKKKITYYTRIQDSHFREFT